MSSAESADDRGIAAAEIDRLLENPSDPHIPDRILALAYDELRHVAAHILRDAPRATSLHPTLLVHEAYLRLVGRRALSWTNRRHFYFALSRAMRDIVVEHARRKLAQKHGGGTERVPIDDIQIPIAANAEETVMLDAALSRLEEQDRMAAEVVSLRLFAGLANDGIAAALGVSSATVGRRWAFGRAWLQRELGR